jgi:hypothetical protein
MAVRRIVEAERVGRCTFVTLNCSHTRSFGGHVYNGIVQAPGQLLGQSYLCREGPCLRDAL